ncbi:MAG: cation-translocating P-type ATPase [bacterium]|nr:cation-translocating P-type ATPase [bacterium]
MSSHVIEIPIRGMDCAGCASTVQKAIAQLPGVESVDVLLNAEKAIIQLDESRVALKDIRQAVTGAGYSVPDAAAETDAGSTDFSKAALNLFGVVFGAVLIIVVLGEGLGLFEALTSRIPFVVGVGLVLLAGYPIFRNVVRATLKRQVISHTLMSLGALAALLIGEWVTAAIVVFFMRVGEYAERFTAERSRRALKNLSAMAPQTARVERGGHETEISITDVRVGDVVVVRPGEKIPVDGEVISGQATLNQAAITGESMPVEISAGGRVFAATLAQLGSLRIRTTRVGADTTFGRIIRLVEEAEANRADVQRIADKFSAYYLPVVAAIAALTYLLSRDPLATAAVMVVACSCSFALATPIAMLASVGAAAKNGLLIKGGKYIEVLAQADVVLLDKTGTLTLGQPQITDVVALNGMSEDEVLALAASAERYSEHPLAEAVRRRAQERGLAFHTIDHFEAVPGFGVRARVNGSQIAVGSGRMAAGTIVPAAAALEQAGKTLLYVLRQDQVVGVMGAADTLRPEIPEAVQALRTLGIQDIAILTGDNERVAQAVAEQLGVSYRANLLPEDKIQVVKDYQAQGRSVVMVGDGVNDAPALAQANVGIAMGAAGTDVALEAAHIALMREDWSLVPEAFRIARRTMRVVRMNIAFTAIYNLLGLSLAAFGILPPILAAAAQSIPDLGILANSSRLLRYRRQDEPRQPFNLPRWSPFIVGGLIALVIGSIALYLRVTPDPTVDRGVKTAVEAFTTFAVMFGFITAVIVHVTARTEQLEAENGGVIPVPECACCSTEDSAVQTPSSSTVIALNDIQVK